MDLALEADISARHLSFLETGRALPSREMVRRLGEALRLPLDAQNDMLTKAGFAARYARRDWNETEMEPIRHALAWQLERHAPYPGLALDRLWTIHSANAAALALFSPFGLGVGDSMLVLITSGALPNAVENWPEVAHNLATRLRLESAAVGGIAEFDAPLRYLSIFESGHTSSLGPVLPMILRHGEMRLSLFVTISQFGAPIDLLLDDLRIELYFPMDAPTEAIFKAL